MEQDLADGDPQLEVPSESVSQGLKDAMLQFFGGSFAPKPRPPSECLDETKKKARPAPVLPRLLRKAPVGLNANLKAIRNVDTDDEDLDAADFGSSYGTSPTVVKRAASFLQSAPTLTPEQQSLIMRTKPKPPRASTDSDLLVPPSPPRTPFNNPFPGGGAIPSGQGSLARYLDTPAAGGPVMHSTFSVVRRASSCRFSESQHVMIIDPQQPLSQAQQEAHHQHPQQQHQQQPQAAPTTLPQQPPPPPTQPPPQQRPCPPRLARQAQPLLPSSALMGTTPEFDRASDLLVGYKPASASLDGRPSRSSTPTGRSLRHGFAPIPAGLSVTAAAAAATAAAGPASPFSATSALAAAAGGAACGGAATAPVVMTNMSSYSPVVSGGGVGVNGVRSGLSSPLSAPPLPASAKPAFIRTLAAGALATPVLSTAFAPQAASPFAAAPASAAAAAAAAAGGDSGGSSCRSPSRRLWPQSAAAQAGGKPATAAAAGGTAGTMAALAMERSGTGGPSGSLPRLSSLRGSGNSFTSIQPRGAVSVWQLAAAAGGGGRASSGDDGDDGELTVVRRSYSAVAGVSPLAAFGMGAGTADVSDGAASGGISGAASAGVILADLSDAESADEGETAAAAAAAAAAAGDVPVRRGGAIGGLLNAFAEEGPLSSAARQLAALHRAQEKSKARKGRPKGPHDAETGSPRWQPSFTSRMG